MNANQRPDNEGDLRSIAVLSAVNQSVNLISIRSLHVDASFTVDEWASRLKQLAFGKFLINIVVDDVVEFQISVARDVRVSNITHIFGECTYSGPPATSSVRRIAQYYQGVIEIRRTKCRKIIVDYEGVSYPMTVAITSTSSAVLACFSTQILQKCSSQGLVLLTSDLSIVEYGQIIPECGRYFIRSKQRREFYVRFVGGKLKFTIGIGLNFNEIADVVAEEMGVLVSELYFVYSGKNVTHADVDELNLTHGGIVDALLKLRGGSGDGCSCDRNQLTLNRYHKRGKTNCFYHNSARMDDKNVEFDTFTMKYRCVNCHIVLVPHTLGCVCGFAHPFNSNATIRSVPKSDTNAAIAEDQISVTDHSVDGDCAVSEEKNIIVTNVPDTPSTERKAIDHSESDGVIDVDELKEDDADKAALTQLKMELDKKLSTYDADYVFPKPASNPIQTGVVQPAVQPSQVALPAPVVQQPVQQAANIVVQSPSVNIVAPILLQPAKKMTAFEQTNVLMQKCATDVEVAFNRAAAPMTITSFRSQTKTDVRWRPDQLPDTTHVLDSARTCLPGHYLNVKQCQALVSKYHDDNKLCMPSLMNHIIVSCDTDQRAECYRSVPLIKEELTLVSVDYDSRHVSAAQTMMAEGLRDLACSQIGRLADWLKFPPRLTNVAVNGVRALIDRHYECNSMQSAIGAVTNTLTGLNVPILPDITTSIGDCIASEQYRVLYCPALLATLLARNNNANKANIDELLACDCARSCGLNIPADMYDDTICGTIRAYHIVKDFQYRPLSALHE